MYKKPQPEDYLKRVVEASVQVPADTAVVLIYDMLAVKDFSAGLSRSESARCSLCTSRNRKRAPTT